MPENDDTPRRFDLPELPSLIELQQAIHAVSTLKGYWHGYQTAESHVLACIESLAQIRTELKKADQDGIIRTSGIGRKLAEATCGILDLAEKFKIDMESEIAALHHARLMVQPNRAG